MKMRLHFCHAHSVSLFSSFFLPTQNQKEGLFRYCLCSMTKTCSFWCTLKRWKEETELSNNFFCLTMTV
uniref:Uncharacterized protein n=1 Tax=Rhizophora mucronata TaxID=61149 RepID=A0A2P2N2A7_RHIMU